MYKTPQELPPVPPPNPNYGPATGGGGASGLDPSQIDPVAAAQAGRVGTWGLGGADGTGGGDPGGVDPSPMPESSLPVSMPGSVGGTFVDPGSRGSLPFHSGEFMNNRFSGMDDNAGDPGGSMGGPGAEIAGGAGIGALGDEDMKRLRSILGGMGQGQGGGMGSGGF
jgi:hypothetical protein